MKIGIILHPYAESKPAGLGEYIFKLTKSLIECDKDNEYIIFLKPFDKIRMSSFDRAQGEVKLPSFRGNNWQVILLGFGRFWRELGLFFASRANVYIFNTPIMPLFFKPKKSIVIALDFAYLYFKPKNWREWMNNKILFWINKFSMKRADSVVAISEATKRDVVKFFGIAEAKIKVVYPGFRNICNLPEKPFSIKKPYFLFVGVIKERKNVHNIVSAFLEFKSKYGLGHKLVIVGKKSGDYFDKILKLIQKEQGEQDIIFTDYVDLNQLAFLYKNASAFVFPSLVEGFGFPLLEAMSCGLSIVTSSTSSLAELADGAALLVNPLDIKEISEAMYEIATDEILRKNLIAKGLERSKNFSWQKCAEEFLKEIKELV